MPNVPGTVRRSPDNATPCLVDTANDERLYRERLRNIEELLRTCEKHAGGIAQDLWGQALPCEPPKLEPSEDLDCVSLYIARIHNHARNLANALEEIQERL